MMPSLKDDKMVVFRADEDLEDDEQNILRIANAVQVTL